MQALLDTLILATVYTDVPELCREGTNHDSRVRVTKSQFRDCSGRCPGKQEGGVVGPICKKNCMRYF